jgi:hypothetical protein
MLSVTLLCYSRDLVGYSLDSETSLSQRKLNLVVVFQ